MAATLENDGVGSLGDVNRLAAILHALDSLEAAKASGGELDQERLKREIAAILAYQGDGDETPSPDDFTPQPVAESAVHSYSSTQFNIPEPLRSAVLALAETVKAADLAEDGREDRPHVTCLFGLHDDSPDAVRKLVSRERPVTITFGSVSLFETERYDVVKIDVHGEDLHRLNKSLATLPHTNTHPAYQPHVTLAYVKAGRGAKYVGKSGLEGATVELSELLFSDKQRKKTVIPLSRQPVPEGCQPNRTGHGYHDDRTGHPCTPGLPPASQGGAGEHTVSAPVGRIQKPGQHLRDALTKAVGGVKAGVEAARKRLGANQFAAMTPKAQGKAARLFALAKAVEHHATAGFRKGAEMAAQVAAERGAPDLEADRVGKVIATVDQILTWTTTFPAVTAVTGSAAAGKVASFLPVASLAYLAYSTARNPLATLRAAKKVFGKAATPAHEAEKAKPVTADAVEDLLHLFAAADDADEAMAGVLVALDQTGGDLDAAIRMVRAAAPPSPDVAEGVGTVTSADFATVNSQRVAEACVPNRAGKGHHDDETGHPCKADGGGDSQKRKPAAAKAKPAATAAAPAAPKGKAVRAEMHAARREGSGKDARVVMADGSPAPPHITPAMVGHDWQDVRVSADPDADVLVTGRDKNGRAKTVYSEAFHMRQAAAKFARTQEGLRLAGEMFEENQRNREDPATREVADCVWLMQLQATRPGSESDNKGVGDYFDRPVTRDDVRVDGDKVTLAVGDKVFPVRDKKTKAEILRRLEAGEPLEDSTFWLKSHGATTLEGRHVVEENGEVYLRFVGKESVWHNHKIRDPKLAKMLLSRKRSGGERDKIFDADYAKVTAYAKTLDGGKFTPKDFRTQRATALAVEAVNRMPTPSGEKEYRASVMKVGEVVSQLLGNDAAMAVKSYIDPNVFTVWRS